MNALSRFIAIDPIPIARAAKTAARDGAVTVYYSVPRITWREPRRKLKLRRHLDLMRAEDRAAYGAHTCIIEVHG